MMHSKSMKMCGALLLCSFSLYAPFEITFSHDFITSVTSNSINPYAYHPYAPILPAKKSALQFMLYCFLTMADYSATGVGIYLVIDRLYTLKESLEAINPHYFWQKPGAWLRKGACYNSFLFDVIKIAILIAATKMGIQVLTHFVCPKELKEP